MIGMTNWDIEAAWSYHNDTKHSYLSVRNNPHHLDWSIQPRPFKIYPGLPPIPLPQEVHKTGRPALSVLDCQPPRASDDAPVSLDDLASILFLSAGITKRRAYPGGEIGFRAAACTGALYEIELYVVCGDLRGLDAGVYIFNPHDFALGRIRAGDYRGALAYAAAGEDTVAHAPVTIVCTGIYWRNAWKYQARTYRHFGWDNGTILANLLAAAAARSLPARVVHGFADDAVNRLLDLDTNTEVALNLVPLGRSTPAVPEITVEVSPLRLEFLPYSRRETDYPSMRAIHEASCLHTPEEVAAWRGKTPAAPPPPPASGLIPLEPFSDGEIPQDSIEEVIMRRGSSRRFAREPVSFRQLSTTLFRATRGVPADFLDPHGAQLNDVYVVAHAVDGLKPGAYFLRRTERALERLKEGNFRKETGYVGLEQDLPADCSAAVFFLADLHAILERFGNRGYRAAQLEAGVIGGRLYLANYAQRLGATGLTFYDDEVTRFFSPHSENKSAIFLVALGKPAKLHRL